MPGGRPKGSPNRVTTTVKDNMLAVYEKLGGRDGMYKWAEKSDENREKFYSWYSRLAPKEVIADVEADLTIQLVSYADDPDPTDQA